MLWAAHIRHHDAPGTADDPDFAETPGDGLWKWFSALMIRYTTVRQILVMTGYMGGVSDKCFIMEYDGFGLCKRSQLSTGTYQHIDRRGTVNHRAEPSNDQSGSRF